LAEFGGGDMVVGFRASERAEPFVDVEQSHGFFGCGRDDQPEIKPNLKKSQ
jgi:hypothetical protein